MKTPVVILLAAVALVLIFWIANYRQQRERDQLAAAISLENAARDSIARDRQRQISEKLRTSGVSSLTTEELSLIAMAVVGSEADSVRKEIARRQATAEKTEDSLRLDQVRLAVKNLRSGRGCYPRSRKKLETLNAEFRGLPISTVSQLFCGYIWLGMKADELRASRGDPESINTSVGSWGKHEQWVYPYGFYAYIEGDTLSSWQD